MTEEGESAAQDWFPGASYSCRGVEVVVGTVLFYSHVFDATPTR